MFTPLAESGGRLIPKDSVSKSCESFHGGWKGVNIPFLIERLELSGEEPWLYTLHRLDESNEG